MLGRQRRHVRKSASPSVVAGAGISGTMLMPWLHNQRVPKVFGSIGMYSGEDRAGLSFVAAADRPGLEGTVMMPLQVARR